MNFEGDDIEDYDKTVNTLVGMGLYSYSLKNFDLDLMNRESPHAKLSSDEPPV